MDDEEAVILVVGTETDYKTRVADALAEGRNASEVENCEISGVRMFRTRSTNKLSIIETVPLVTYPGWSILDNSRQWIARNSLKKLFGKLIFVLCVATSSGPNDDIHKEPDFANNKFSWLNLLSCIFNEDQRSIMILVKLKGNHDSGATKGGMTDILRRDGFNTSDIMCAEERKEDINKFVKRALELSVRRSGLYLPTSSPHSVRPFRLKEVTNEAEKLGPWGPDRLILLGRTGSGKSTLAEMLVSGKLDPTSQHFASSSSIRGETKEVAHGEGRGWYVVDTPGFGEPNDKRSTVSSEAAQTKIKKYVRLIEGTYTHFIHVMMKGRIDDLEEKLWQFFVLLFGKDIMDNFTIVISSATQGWVENNMKALQESFPGCNNFLSAEFPPVPTDDPELEEELSEARETSLKALEDGLTVLYRCHTYCDFGQYSKMNIRREKAELALATRDTKSWLRKAAMAVRAGAKGTSSDFRRLALMMSNDDRILLLPTPAL